MALLKEQSLPIRPHYFWPLLTQPLKENNIAGTNTHGYISSQTFLRWYSFKKIALTQIIIII